jgi:ribonuclease BN (tRNA processing enzyme)
MKVTFLGTNGWYDTVTGNTCSVLIQSEKFDIILDAGNGIAKVDRYITQDKPVYLFISHFHLDHITGLHTLVKFNFWEGLNICGQPGTEEILKSLVREPFTVPFAKLPYPVNFIELSEGRHNDPFPIECRLLLHPVPCFGYRLVIDNRIITYCTDTGFCENAVLLAQDADLLITECGLLPGEQSPGWPHLNPETAIRIAKESDAKRLALMHFGAEVYKSSDDRARIKKQFEPSFPGLIVASDDLSIEL